MKSILYSFPPIASRDSRVLILGSMPGKESLRRQQYYAYPRNSFWKIMFALTNREFSTDYRERQECLLEHKIALWDVMKSCRRKGSLDSAIRNESVVTNDFQSFFQEYLNIEYVFFNGATAEKTYKKLVIPVISGSFDYLAYHRLPSTSPAMASLNTHGKILQWQCVIDACD